ncbi:hypothetical protein COV82_05030 [Candidatus Peregrinibacteria bacterium CG11_big_fil_rev_8_21_14_0_20_46_8]|nr:MAG: hypothetical protein COV82_05030 [Candidatus Peregrinibacteria bacterium CG11_big_fil_rev_8_21_14_0_20_46_8]
MKYLLITIGIVLIAVSILTLPLPGGKKSEASIKRTIQNAQYCTTKADCVQVESKCPFGCWVFVNKKEASNIQTLIDSYESRCIYSCIELQGYDCINNRCEAVL